MVDKAGTLLIPSGPSHNPRLKHLHIVCTDPCINNFQLIVPVTTWTNSLCDETCILDVGDHPFIKHRTWVMYRKTKIESCSTIENIAKGLRDESLRICVPMEEDVFQRVYQGIMQSTFTPKKIKKYVEQQSFPIQPPAQSIIVQEAVKNQ